MRTETYDSPLLDQNTEQPTNNLINILMVLPELGNNASGSDGLCYYSSEEMQNTEDETCNLIPLQLTEG